MTPGLNESDVELHDIATFLAETSVGIPWHAARPASCRITAWRIGRPARRPRCIVPGRSAGRLDCVMTHNRNVVLQPLVGRPSDTACPTCGARSIQWGQLTRAPVLDTPGTQIVQRPSQGYGHDPAKGGR